MLSSHKWASSSTSYNTSDYKISLPAKALLPSEKHTTQWVLEEPQACPWPQNTATSELVRVKKTLTINMCSFNLLNYIGKCIFLKNIFNNMLSLNGQLQGKNQTTVPFNELWLLMTQHCNQWLYTKTVQMGHDPSSYTNFTKGKVAKFIPELLRSYTPNSWAGLFFFSKLDC